MTATAQSPMNFLKTPYEPLLTRHPSNPILSGKDWPYSVNSIFNAGATLLADGSTLLLCRVEERRGLSHLCVARSLNGVDGWQIDKEPTLMPDPVHYPEEIWGIEDPRITFVPELQQYVVTYTSYSRGGPGVSLALTKDFRDFERIGVIMPPDDKDAALLPRRINGHWALIHRPMTTLGSHMWISYSPDLVHWGRHRLMLEARRGAWWMPTKLASHRRPSRHPEDGLFSTTESGTRPPAVSIDWALPSSISRIQKFACSGAIRGSSGLRPSMSVTEMWTMWFFLADTRWLQTAIRSISITEPPIARSPWLAQASVLYSLG